MVTKFWKSYVSTTEHLSPSPNSFLSSHRHPGRQQVHSLGPETDSLLPLTFHIQWNSKYSVPCPPSSLHALSPPWSPCFTLNTLPLWSVLFGLLWQQDSSPRYPQGALPNPVQVSFQTSRCQSSFLWWPYHPTLATFRLLNLPFFMAPYCHWAYSVPLLFVCTAILPPLEYKLHKFRDVVLFYPRCLGQCLTPKMYWIM